MAAMLQPANIATALIVMNFIAFVAFGIDKARAEGGRWRVQESTLLLLELFGGTIGAYAGRALFRHKTRKQSFSNDLRMILVLQIIGIGGCAVWMLSR